MAKDFVAPSNPVTEKIVRESTSYIEMLEALKAAGREGVMSPAEPAVTVPATSGYAFEKTIRFDPESGKRPLVIRATTQADLDALEAQILGY